MTTRTRASLLLLAIAVVAFTLCACLDNGERSEWQAEVLSRQRGLERPTPTVIAEVEP